MDKTSFGQKLCSEYYGALMRTRDERGTLSSFYGEDSQMIYNGTECNGLKAINHHILSLGFNKIIYKIESMDVIERPGMYSILVFGALQMDDSDEFRFSQTFNVAQNQTGGFYIVTDILRLLM